MPVASAPDKPEFGGVQRVKRENQVARLFRGQASAHETQVASLVGTVDFIAHERVAPMREMNAQLMFASRVRAQTKQCEPSRSGGGRYLGTR